MANITGGIARSFKQLKGNAKACIWTEWMWAVPNALYAAYATLYMQELGLSLAQIGYISSITLTVQVVSSLLSGVIGDKMGRRLSTLIFDCISWGIPVILWSAARSYAWFVAAALFNGLWRITGVTFGLLMAEDTPHEELVGLFSINQLMSLLSAFFAPIAKVCVDRWGLVPTMRAVYGVAIVLMWSKFIILYFLTRESAIGLRRMEQTKDVSAFRLLWDCRKVFWNLMKSKELLLTMAVLVAYNVTQTLNTNFWSIIVTSRLGVNKADVSLFTTLRSAVQITVIFFVVPRISSARFKNPMLAAWASLALSQALIVLTPAGPAAVAVLVVSVALEGFAIACMYPVMESLLYINTDPEQRSRILGMVYAVMVLIMTAFPAVAGRLSGWDVRAPMYINLALFAIGAGLTCALWNIRKETKTAEQ